MALGTGKSYPICKMSLFLMSNEIGRGVSVSSREQIILKGGSILTRGVWLALLTTEDPALVTQRGPLSLVGLRESEFQFAESQVGDSPGPLLLSFSLDRKGMVVKEISLKSSCLCVFHIL